jgi:hypothetical protein
MTREAEGDLICAEIIRSATALQAAIYERMDGNPKATRTMQAIVLKIVSDFERLEEIDR